MLIRRYEYIAVILAALAILSAGFTSNDEPLPGATALIPAEDGYRLWLRYEPLGDLANRYRDMIREVVVFGDSETSRVISRELETAIHAMLDASVDIVKAWNRKPAVIVGTPSNSELIRGLGIEADLGAAGIEGFVIRSARIENQPVTVIASEGETGALYGAFHFLRLLQTGQPIRDLAIVEHPRVQLRLLNHWDNLNGSIERGYAGRSLWQWEELPDEISARYTDYARANASIGVNGTVINNVNADARILTEEYLRKVAVLADLWRPYGIRVYLSANFAAPVRLGGLETADPLDPEVANWWKTKASEIYRLIPDFGGFL